MFKKDLEKGEINPLVWLLIIVVGLWVLWYFTGGPQRANTQTGPFQNPSAPLGNGQGYDTIGH